MNVGPRLPKIQTRAKSLSTELHYRRIDARDTPLLNAVTEDIATTHNRLNGLIAAAGIQPETSALEYSAEDANRMFEVNVTGVFMAAQAVAREMVRLGDNRDRGGSIVLVASMSGFVANNLCSFLSSGCCCMLWYGS